MDETVTKLLPSYFLQFLVPFCTNSVFKSEFKRKVMTKIMDNRSNFNTATVT